MSGTIPDCWSKMEEPPAFWSSGQDWLFHFHWSMIKVLQTNFECPTSHYLEIHSYHLGCNWGPVVMKAILDSECEENWSRAYKIYKSVDLRLQGDSYRRRYSLRYPGSSRPFRAGSGKASNSSWHWRFIQLFKHLYNMICQNQLNSLYHSQLVNHLYVQPH